MSVLLRLVPLEYWTAVTSISSVDELLHDGINKQLSVKKKSEVNQNQMHCRMAWKGTLPVSGSGEFQVIHFEAEALVTLLFQLYQTMFSNENMQRLLSSLNLMALRNSSRIFYHRSSLVALRKYIKARVKVDWSTMMTTLLRKIEGDEALLIGRHYIQELYLQLHLAGLYSTPPLLPGLIQPRDNIWPTGIGAWKNIPGVICLTIEVPRTKLSPLTSMAPLDVGTPMVHGMLQSHGVITGHWQNIFADVQLGFGKIILHGLRQNANFKIFVEEDPQGWKGTSSLIACFYVPTWTLLLDTQSTTVSVGLKSTPHSATTFVRQLGLELSIFQTPLMHERHVFISEFAPNHSGHPSFSSYTPQSKLQADDTEPVQTVTINLNESTGQILGFTGRLDGFNEEIKSALLNGAIVKNSQSSPFTVTIYIGDSTCALNFPAPVKPKMSIIRVARRSSYVEVRYQLTNDTLGQHHPTFMYPTCISRGSVVACNMPYLRLKDLPIMDISRPEKLEWLNPHASFQMSGRERALRDSAVAANRPHEDARINFKDSLFTLFMLSAGLQGRRVCYFNLNHPDRGLSIILIVANLRVDLANHTVCLDTAVIPLTNTNTPNVAPLIKPPSRTTVCNITVNDKELKLWKEVLPAMVERCREWKHGPDCEYLTTQKVPLSTDDGQPALCSCGQGVFPLDYINGVPGWNVAQKYAFRAAISPSFFVPYVEAPVDFPQMSSTLDESNDEKPNGSYCQKCRKEELPDAAKLLACGRCKKTWYCSTECQRADYKAHKSACRLMQT